MTTPTVTETRPRQPIGQRVELGRYSIGVGDRLIVGQRVDGIVRFLLESAVALVDWCGCGEDSKCRPRTLGSAVPPPTSRRGAR